MQDPRRRRRHVLGRLFRFQLKERLIDCHVAPSFFSQRAMLPSVIDSPTLGTLMSIGIFYCPCGAG